MFGEGGSRFGSGLALACVLGSAPALATSPDTGTSRRLLDFPVRLEPSTLGLPGSVSAADLTRELEAAARAWSYPAVACTSVVFEVQAAAPRLRAARDGSFRVLFRSTTWCHNERCGHLGSFPMHVAAMTTLYPESGDGPIAEADIELNGVSFAWEDAASRGRPSHRTASLRGALVHEIGHVVGLRDACPEAPENTDSGCDSAMLSGDRVRPSDTDVRWLCAAYPRTRSAGAITEAVKPSLLRTQVAWAALFVAVLLLLCLTNAKIRLTVKLFT